MGLFIFIWLNLALFKKQRVDFLIFIEIQRVVFDIYGVKRLVEVELDSWLTSKGRKPLILRGARQVGKTWLVRNLAKNSQKKLVELNFERDPLAKSFLKFNDPQKIIDEISLSLNQPIKLDETILFLDEIQAAGEILAKLRWFSEEMPKLPVIAAGSLLEFTLSDHSFSMPVGRIKYLHVEPMGFFEYLEAHGQLMLVDRLKNWMPKQEYSPSLHQQCLIWFQRYCMVGGMPEVVKTDVDGGDAVDCRERQSDLVATYRADFAKYRKKIDVSILDSVLQSISGSIGEKFVYSKAGHGIKHYEAKKALEMLSAARICHFIKYSSGNGLPLGGEIKQTFKKVILNDIGLFHAMVRTPAQKSFPQWEKISPVIKGKITEQVCGQLLRLHGPFHGNGPELYYWQREGGRPGEIDYLLQSDTQILPVEIKSGAAGSMKSLHQFMYDKNLEYALRFDGSPPSTQQMQIKTTQGHNVSYILQNLPWYLTERANQFNQ